MPVEIVELPAEAVAKAREAHREVDDVLAACGMDEVFNAAKAERLAYEALAPVLSALEPGAGPPKAHVKLDIEELSVGRYGFSMQARTPLGLAVIEAMGWSQAEAE